MKDFLKNHAFNRTLYFLYITTLFLFIAEFGFNLPRWSFPIISSFYIFILSISVVLTICRYIFLVKELVLNAVFFDLVSIFFIVYCVYKQLTYPGPEVISWLRFAVILKLIREFVTPRINYKRSVLNPAQLFVLSFMGIILVGSLLLMLPNATHHGISYIDALFTSTSAVCVTGLIVVDTGTFFTHFGHTIIMILIQIGGLGILTFVSYFSYFFRGGTTYENQLALGDISNSGRFGDVFTTLKRILVITFFIESIGAFFIYISLNARLFPTIYDRIYFSVFHSISAFCNAGFSTVPNGFMNAKYVGNYQFIFTIALIIVFGGLGFPIVINILKLFKNWFKRRILWFIYGRDQYKPWILTLSSKVNLVTTAILLIVGTLVIYSSEYQNVLAVHHGIGKWATAFLAAVSPRTAGFNSINFGQIHFSTSLFIILLMWIGTNPGSTGGGIKTSTFAIAILNSFSLAKSKSKIEIWRREISQGTVNRAFSQITLSLMVIGISIYLISIFDGQFGLLHISFECFSAFSTTGLSMGITSHLSSASKIVLIGTMFVGRVSTLSILVTFFKKAKSLNYHYPTDEITIN